MISNWHRTNGKKVEPKVNKGLRIRYNKDFKNKVLLYGLDNNLLAKELSNHFNIEVSTLINWSYYGYNISQLLKYNLVKKVIELDKDGISQCEISRRLNISPRTIRKYLGGKDGLQ